MLKFIFKLLFGKPSADTMFDTVSYKTRVKLWDIDPNIHLTNSKYLVYFDRGRAQCMYEIGFIRGFMKTKISAVVSAVNITYIREVKPFERFEVKTCYLGWDEKYFYIKQEMLVKDELKATSISRVCPLKKGLKVSPEEMLNAFDINVKKPALPEIVHEWKKVLQKRV